MPDTAPALEERRFPRDVALDAVREILAVFTPACERVIVAGSLRRRKPDVGDAEIVYIPKYKIVRADLFTDGLEPEPDAVLERLLKDGVIEKRLSVSGFTAWGQSNKFATHLRTGLPIDFFCANPGNWWNYVACRTGPMQSNIAVCEAARRKGWRWNPYGEGFRDNHGRIHPVACEREVFELVGLPYYEPWHRR